MGMDVSVELHKDLEPRNRFAGQIWSTRERAQSWPKRIQPTPTFFGPAK
jgi:hypothetical protein